MSPRASPRPAKDLGVDATIINPTTDDPAEQVRAIEDLIAKKVDVIGVIPNDGKALEPVLGRAQAAGHQGHHERVAGAEERRLGYRAHPGQGFRRGASGGLRRCDRRRRQVRRLRRRFDCRRCTISGPTMRSRCRSKNTRRCSRSATASASPTAWKTVTRRRSTRCRRIPTSRDFSSSAPTVRSAPVRRCRSGQDRKGHRRRSVHSEPGSQAHEGRSDHARLPLEPHRLGLRAGRSRQDAGDRRRDQGRHGVAGHGGRAGRASTSMSSAPTSRSTSTRRSIDKWAKII